MKSLGRPLLGIALTVSLVLRLAGVSAAQIIFDPAVYQALADVDSAAAIPAGTKITTANWQHYRQFMTIWMQAAYQGQYHWHVEAGKSEDTVEVAPATHCPLPAKFVANTARYAGQALVGGIPPGGRPGVGA